ncbi:hypothetical protein C1646_759606 [Rhizophagus diaphanus]|nr:hypothetical protein C1646_759606 [Rhizophagus diaphanus] [Rhizophagus sp. MUCL 43196]
MDVDSTSKPMMSTVGTSMGVEFEEKIGPEFIYKEDMEEIVTRAQVVTMETLKSNVPSESLDEEEVVDIVNKHRKSVLSSRFSKEVLDTNGHVTQDEVVTSSIILGKRIKVIKPKRFKKKEEISEDEKIGQKRSGKEEISRGIVSSSSENDWESGSENIATEVAHKISAQVGKGKKGGKSKKKNKKKWIVSR